MACRLFGDKPLSEPMLPYYQLDHKEHISVKFHSEFNSFHSRKYTWKCRLRNGVNFVSASINVASVSLSYNIAISTDYPSIGPPLT